MSFQKLNESLPLVILDTSVFISALLSKIRIVHLVKLFIIGVKIDLIL